MDTWTDDRGIVRRVPSTKQRMDYVKFGTHAAVRAFVFRRDRFTCQHCGRRNSRLKNYDGRSAPKSDDYTLLCIDHRLCIRHGGTNHPDNLQVLCDPCNARKVTTHDRFGRAG